MFKIGSNRRVMAGAAARGSVVSGATPVLMKSQRQWMAGDDGAIESRQVRTKLSASFGGSGGGFSGGGSARVDTFNAVVDDLSKGSVVESWIPADPRLQTRMFKMMYARGGIEGNIIDTINDLIWSDFDFVGLKDKAILDTFNASKEATRVHETLPHVTVEHLVTGLCVAQFILDPTLGIWRDVMIVERDNLKITEIPRFGYAPMIDMLPTPAMQAWVKSTDPRMVESRKGIPKAFLDSLMASKPMPMDPAITAYMPRRQFHNDVQGTSYFVRNLLMWGLEKSLIDATMTGHRRRSGPITQVKVGSDTYEATSDQIDAYVAALIGAEEDSVNSVIGTRHDVDFSVVRGGLQEMWKWQDEVGFIADYKMKQYGFSDQFLTGDAMVDVTSQPTIFLERLKARRKEITQEYLINKFCRSLAKVHDFRQRSQAQLDHRIRINDDDDLILPSIRFHRNLDAPVDQARADILEKMEEKGLYVGGREWNEALGGGDYLERLRAASADLDMRLKAMQLTRITEKVKAMRESVADSSTTEVDEQVQELRRDLAKITFNDDDVSLDVASLDDAGKKRAAEMADGQLTGSVIHPTDVKDRGPHDSLLLRVAHDPHGYDGRGKVA